MATGRTSEPFSANKVSENKVSANKAWSCPVAAEDGMGRSAVRHQAIDLWPGKPPGDVGIDLKDDERRRKETWCWATAPDSDVPGGEYRRTCTSSVPGLGEIRILTNVSKPTITIYSPPEDKNTGTAIIICPGGGYHNLLWELEGEDVAAWCASVGITGVILKYRVPRRPDDPGFGQPTMPPPRGPLIDAQRAISLVRSRAAEWKINPRRIGIGGFSAGGHLAVLAAIRFSQRAYEAVDAAEETSCRPDFAFGCYSGYFKDKERDAVVPEIVVPPDTPPVLLAHATDDHISDAENSAFMYVALKRAGIPAELHIYATGNHDFAARQEENLLPSSWLQLCLKWLQNQNLFTPR